MKSTPFILCSLLILGCDPRKDIIPENIVGIWTSSDAVLNGELLIEGQAIYLGSDGAGALLVGPPPIGVKITATFNSSTETIDLNMIEHERAVRKISAKFNSTNNTIILISGKENVQTLYRRFDHLTRKTKKAIGI